MCTSDLIVAFPLSTKPYNKIDNPIQPPIISPLAAAAAVPSPSPQRVMRSGVVRLLARASAPPPPPKIRY